MVDLIEALNIFLKYSKKRWPTHCAHDEFHVMVSPDVVSDEDKARLEDLGFYPGEYDDFVSYRFGSC